MSDSRFTLHTHPRDKRVAVFDKESQSVFVLFSWYHKCLELEEAMNDYVLDDRDMYTFLKTKAPHVLFCQKEDEVDAYTLMDMLAVHPNDDWLLNLEKQFLDLKYMKNVPALTFLVLLWNVPKHMKFIFLTTCFVMK